jgi:hypothetical protein
VGVGGPQVLVTLEQHDVICTADSRQMRTLNGVLLREKCQTSCQIQLGGTVHRYLSPLNSTRSSAAKEHAEQAQDVA